MHAGRERADNLARRVEHAERVELAQIWDEAHAELWQGGYGLDEDEQLFIDMEDVPIGADLHIKQTIDDCMRDGS